MKKIIIIIIVAIAGLVMWSNQTTIRQFLKPAQPVGVPGVTSTANTTKKPEADVVMVAKNLRIPWEIAFLPNGEMLVTERPGNLVKFGTEKTVITIEDTERIGEGGLQGMALHPDFVQNNFIYLYRTTKNNGRLINQVIRYRLRDTVLDDKKIILDNIPASKYHDGGRIAFGPDKKLYVTTGDAEQKTRAQDTSYLGGKILRMNDDGTTPTDNPFSNSLVYSYGHRNPQGIAWDGEGKLWATEHGRSIPLSGYDELNHIGAGKNYGWPTIQGNATQAGMETPVINSGADTTWAPAGLLYYAGHLFFTGLRGEALYEFDPDTKKITAHFFKEFGRLRAITLGPDGWFYVSTSNTDGRGVARDSDDQIIKINPIVFNQ